jgi:hypothetical protein
VWLRLDEITKLFPAIAVLTSILALLVSLRKDRKLRLKEYSDRVRRSAALVVARADRWKHLSLGLFQDIQVAITDADIILMNNRDVRQADDFFWRELFIAQRAIAKKLTDEQIEIAYVDLFGYDAKIHDLFSALVQRLAATDRRVFVALLKRAQNDILGSYNQEGVYVSTELGNRLRVTARESASWCSDLMEAALVEFRNEMIKIVRATDEAIAQKKVAIRSPAEVFAGFHEIAEMPTAGKVTSPDVKSLGLPAAQAAAAGEGSREYPLEVPGQNRSVKTNSAVSVNPRTPIAARNPGPPVLPLPLPAKDSKQPELPTLHFDGGRDADMAVFGVDPPSAYSPPPRGGYEDDDA